MDKNKIALLQSLIDDLSFDFERLSGSGQETYNDLCILVGLEPLTDDRHAYCDVSDRFNTIGE